MSRILTIDEAANWFKMNDDYLIITHRRPDGDAAGSAGALAQGLREFGKNAFVFENPEITPRYLPYIENYIAPSDYSPANIVTVDTASHEMFPENIDAYKDSIVLCIDHHASNSYYASLTCLEPNRAACGELIYEILISLSGSISQETSKGLYTAIVSDTGCFSYSNTTAQTLRIASELFEFGAPHTELNKLLFRTKTQSRIKIEGMISAGLEFHFGGIVAISTITGKMKEDSGATEDDLDDIASIPSSIEGVLCGITLSELTSPLDCKASVRTVADINAADICAYFGGGGHLMAAGFSLDKPISEVKASLLEMLPKHLSI